MQRRCTDAPCLLFFLAFLAGLGFLGYSAGKRGNLEKLTRGIDWQGRICGVDPDVADRPLLYWCDPGEGTELQLLDGACVSTCPMDGSPTWCPGKAKPFQVTAPPIGPGGVRQVVVGGRAIKIRNVTLKMGYPTVDAIGYCFPTRNLLVRKIVEQTHVSGPTKQLFLAAHGALQSWRFLLLASGGTVVLGYCFLFLLWACFDKLIYVLAFALHALMLLSIAGSGYIGFHDEYNVFGHWFDMSTARLCAFLCCGLLLILWSLFLLLSLYSKDALRSTVESVNATCGTVAQLPSLLMQPLAHSVFTVAALVLLVYGFAWVLSIGKVVPLGEPVEQGGVKIAGMHRTLEFSAVEWLAVLYWVFGMVWIMETMNGMGQFAISHAVVSFANPIREDCGRSCFPVLRGYCVGVGFHLGSIAFGGFVLGILKILAAVLTFLARQARDEAGVRGALARAVCCCCAQCALFVEQALSMVNDLVYTDMALQGSRYMEAADNVVRVAASNPADYALLKSSAMAVRVLGVLAITGASTVLAFQGLSSPAFRHLIEHGVSPDAAEVLDTPSLQGTTVAVALISFQISMTFMTVFYQTTHALTYCMLIGAATVGPGSPKSPRSARDTALLPGARDSV